jgi:hypothetical protein
LEAKTRALAGRHFGCPTATREPTRSSTTCAPERRGRCDGRRSPRRTQTGWSIKKFVRTSRRYYSVQIKAGRQILTAADPLPGDLCEAIVKIGGKLEHQDEPTRDVTRSGRP